MMYNFARFLKSSVGVLGVFWTGPFSFLDLGQDSMARIRKELEFKGFRPGFSCLRCAEKIRVTRATKLCALSFPCIRIISIHHFSVFFSCFGRRRSTGRKLGTGGFSENHPKSS